jgi:hypothetical protein
LLSLNLSAQSAEKVNDKPKIEKRTYAATKLTKAPKIDGDISDEIWQMVPITSDFTQYDPKPYAQPSQRTELRLAYDNEAIYFAVKLFDKPADVRKELSQRDAAIFNANTDYFTISFDTYNDDQNGMRFVISAAGLQADAKLGKFDQGNGNWSNADFSWDAVWESAVKIEADAWTIEAKIPFLNLRFAKKPEQIWGFQCARFIQRLGEVSTWQILDPTVDGQVIQFGDLTGLKNLEPPLRLSFSPYLATSLAHTPTSTTDASGKTVYTNQKSISGGMDLKWGLNEAFTLDATLIPNFGQVQSDNQILNLGPFEVQFQERRPFFTEGVELFNKGDIFYSRRVGGTPDGYWNVSGYLGANERVKFNPNETQLFNATKVSGRTKSKLGIGVFNAVAAPMHATIENTETGAERRIQTSVLTNYNVTTFNQALKNNSEIYLTNANTMRDGDSRDANVTALGTRLRDKKNRYELAVSGRMSHIFDPSVSGVESGYTASWAVSKVSGNWTWSVDQSMQTDKWNPDDLGIFQGNNWVNSHVGIFYQQTQPNKYFLQSNWWFNVNQNMRYKPFVHQDYGINAGFWAKLKNQGTINYWLYTQPDWAYDYFEPRYEGKKMRYAPFYNCGTNINTDQRKRLKWYFYVGTNQGWGWEPRRTRWNFATEPSYQVSNKLSLGFNIFASISKNERGYANSTGIQNIIFGRRDRLSSENTFSANYKFSPMSNLTFRARHYWSTVEYREYYQLQDDGNMSPVDWNRNENRHANIFNIDMIYTWQFAPGSFFNAIWKNSIYDSEIGQKARIDDTYFEHAGNMIRGPQTNSLIVKLIYFLDYNKAKSWLKV